VRDNNLTYTNLIDETGNVSGQYGVSSTPVKFLIDAEGNMIGAAMGYREWDSDEVKAMIETVMDTKE
jgi:thioredoxin-related protein